MLQKPKLSRIKSKAKRQLKKYAKYVIRMMDNTTRGTKIYTFVLSDGQTVTTSKPKQKDSKTYPWRYALWLKNTISRMVLY